MSCGEFKVDIVILIFYMLMVGWVRHDIWNLKDLNLWPFGGWYMS